VLIALKRNAQPARPDSLPPTQLQPTVSLTIQLALMPFATSLKPKDVPNVPQDIYSPKKTPRISLIVLLALKLVALLALPLNVPLAKPDGTLTTKLALPVPQSADVLLVPQPPNVPLAHQTSSSLDPPVPLVEPDVWNVPPLMSVLNAKKKTS
jgi:hypothetical protein